MVNHTSLRGGKGVAQNGATNSTSNKTRTYQRKELINFRMIITILMETYPIPDLMMSLAPVDSKQLRREWQRQLVGKLRQRALRKQAAEDSTWHHGELLQWDSTKHRRGSDLVHDRLHQVKHSRWDGMWRRQASVQDYDMWHQLTEHCGKWHLEATSQHCGRWHLRAIDLLDGKWHQLAVDRDCDTLRRDNWTAPHEYWWP